MDCLVIERLSIQNLNAVSGQVFGAVGIVPSLGFVHALQRKLNELPQYQSLVLTGCIVAVHYQHIHTYHNEHHSLKFLQSRNPAVSFYGTDNAKKSVAPAVIEEGKMNAEISLIIPYESDLQSHQVENLKKDIGDLCYRLRFAGGTILNHQAINTYVISSDDEKNIQLRQMIRRLLPSFILYDCRDVLAEHIAKQKQDNTEFDELDGLMDFIGLKMVARPKHHLIDKHLNELRQPEKDLNTLWQTHLKNPYSPNDVPDDIRQYFAELAQTKAKNKPKALLKQWEEYCNPNHKTDADWGYLPKPQKGYFVPMMCGYKAISPVYSAGQVANTRDEETDVCFVEAVHTLGQWRGIHRIKTLADLQNAVWHYDYQEHWYLCRQGQGNPSAQSTIIADENSDYSDI